MNHQVSGSTFSQSSIRKLKQFSLELDMFLIIKRLRFLNFKDSKKVLIDLKTLAPIEIKNGTQCIVTPYNKKYSFISVGPFYFLVKNLELK